MENMRPPAAFHFDNPPHVTIVEARFYDAIADLQLKGVKEVLDCAKATYEIVTVPGSFEIPAAISFAIKSLDFDPVRRRSNGFVALGCILQGGTRHAELVARACMDGLQDLAIRRSLAIGNGILTCDTMEQAIERADPARMNRGGAAAEACLRMVEVKEHFHLSTKRRWVAKQDH